MSVEQLDKVDFIGVDKVSGKIILTIADGLDWHDERSHLVALQDKINTYVAFIESGELHAVYPDSIGRVPVIDIVHRLPLPVAARTLLEKARPILSDAGIELSSRQLVT